VSYSSSSETQCFTFDYRSFRVAQHQHDSYSNNPASITLPLENAGRARARNCCPEEYPSARMTKKAEVGAFLDLDKLEEPSN
jgi:hypothetical protein